MKKLLVLIASCWGMTALAAYPADPWEVCDAISRVNSSNGLKCSKIASKSYLDRDGTSICMAIIKGGGASSNAVQCMQNIANKSIEPDAAGVCVAIARTNSSNAAKCALVISNKTYPQGATRFCRNMADRGSATSSVVQCMQEHGRLNRHDRPHPPTYPGGRHGVCMTKNEIVSGLGRAKRTLVEGRTYRTEQILNRMLSRMQNCGHRGPRVVDPF